MWCKKHSFRRFTPHFLITQRVEGGGFLPKKGLERLSTSEFYAAVPGPSKAVSSKMGVVQHTLPEMHAMHECLLFGLSPGVIHATGGGFIGPIETKCPVFGSAN